MRTWISRVAVTVFLGSLLLTGMLAGMVTAAFPVLPSLEHRAEKTDLVGLVLARDNRTVLRRLTAPESRTRLRTGQLPPLVGDAVIAAEDRRFREHSGIDVRGIARALVSDIRSRAAVEGGSTITQQLVKNAYVGPRQTIGRKTREAALAVALETRWSKDRILTAYVNTAYFGNGLYGIADASRGYFGVPVTKLRPAQAALLASILRAPEINNPITNPPLARRARHRVLTQMQDTGMLSPQLAAAADRAPMPSPDVFQRRRSTVTREVAPQFTDAVVAAAIDRYGVRRTLDSGLRIHSTLDARMQRAATNAMQQAADAGLDAAIVAIDVRSGEVRVMANGGRAARSAFNVATQGHRQPGSAIKPFVLAAAANTGIAPASEFLSAPYSGTVDTIGGPVPFHVTNDEGYVGTTTLQRATWHSDNTVFARLQERVGITNEIEMARAAGITSRLDELPSLVLGGLPDGTTPVELAHAYTTFAAHGERTDLVDGGGPRIIARITNADGGSAWRPAAYRRNTVSRDVADTVTATLRGVITSGTGTRANIGRPAAGKTGTTENNRDAWFVGYTPSLVTAVWVGHVRGGIPMRSEFHGGPVMGGTYPALIWHDFMRDALANDAPEAFALRVPRAVKVTIDPRNGLLADEWCANAVTEWVFAGKEPMGSSADCTPARRALPDVVGLSLQDAQAQLSDLQFDSAIDTAEQPTGDQTKDNIVVSMDPPAGTRVTRDGQLTLTVARFDPSLSQAPTTDTTPADTSTQTQTQTDTAPAAGNNSGAGAGPTATRPTTH